MNKINKNAFIIIRVTRVEKDSLLASAKKARMVFSKFIRELLGLGK